MPTYEYLCNACGHRFEELQTFSEPVLKKCPKCKKKKLERLIGMGAAIVFKGTGFYQTDYRSDSYKSDAKADQAPQPADKTGADATPKSTATKDSGGAAEAGAAKTAPKKAKS